MVLYQGRSDGAVNCHSCHHKAMYGKRLSFSQAACQCFKHCAGAYLVEHPGFSSLTAVSCSLNPKAMRMPRAQASTFVGLLIIIIIIIWPCVQLPQEQQSKLHFFSKQPVVVLLVGQGESQSTAPVAGM